MSAVKESVGTVCAAVVTQLEMAQVAEYVCSTKISWYSVSAVVTQLVQSAVKNLVV